MFDSRGEQFRIPDTFASALSGFDDSIATISRFVDRQEHEAQQNLRRPAMLADHAKNAIKKKMPRMRQ